MSADVAGRGTGPLGGQSRRWLLPDQAGSARGRCAVYVPPVFDLGLAEVEHERLNTRMRAR